MKDCKNRFTQVFQKTNLKCNTPKLTYLIQRASEKNKKEHTLPPNLLLEKNTQQKQKRKLAMFDKADTKTENNAILSLTFLINWTRQLKKKMQEIAFLRKPTKEIRKNRSGNL